MKMEGEIITAILFLYLPLTCVASTHPVLHYYNNNNNELVMKMYTSRFHEIYDTSKYGTYHLNNGLASTPQMGWNSWNHFQCGINETIIMQTEGAKNALLLSGFLRILSFLLLILPSCQADALISTGLADLGYVYVNIDDCWSSSTRNSKGQLVPDPKAFPSGIKALADYVHSKGLKFGIYSDSGNLTCGRRPGSLFHEKDDAQLFASWGVDYLKYDNCFDQNIPPKERYPPMRDALIATHRPIFYSLCEWGVDDPALWAGKVGNSWRTTEDINGSWVSVTSIADRTDKWAAYAGPGGWNDPDMLEVGNGELTFHEYRAHFSIWALMKAPLLSGCDMRNISTETKEILGNKEVISVNQDPLGVQGRKVNVSGENDCQQVWAGPLSGSKLVVALWNRCSDAKTITASWDVLGLQSSVGVSIRDLWQHKEVVSEARGSYGVQLDAHDCAFYIFTTLTA